MDSSPRLASPTCSILHLPLELHREIIDHLPMQDKVCLGLTNRYFRAIIKPPTFSELLEAESMPWAIDKRLFACRYCTQLRSLEAFTNDMRKGRKGRHGLEAQSRFCVWCGVTEGHYKVGTELAILDRRFVVCRGPEEATPIGSRDACSLCRPLPPTIRHQRDTGSASGPGTYPDYGDVEYSSRANVGYGRLEDLLELYSRI